MALRSSVWCVSHAGVFGGFFLGAFVFGCNGTGGCWCFFLALCAPVLVSVPSLSASPSFCCHSSCVSCWYPFLFQVFGRCVPHLAKFLLKMCCVLTFLLFCCCSRRRGSNVPLCSVEFLGSGCSCRSTCGSLSCPLCKLLARLGGLVQVTNRSQ